MATVAIIGAGDAGGATADALARSSALERILLVDEARGVAEGKALDIQQACALTGSRTRVDGTDLLPDARGCAVCIIADAARGGDAPGLGYLVQVVGIVGPAPLVFAGAAQATALGSAAADLALPGRRLAGAAGLAVTSAAAAITAIEAECSPREVSLTVLGSPGGGWVVPWGQAALSGIALERVLQPPHMRRIEARLARLWPPGPHLLGVAAARLVRAMLTSSREALPVLTTLDGVFGVRGRVGTVPARLSPQGIAELVEPDLSPRDRTALHTALRW